MQEREQDKNITYPCKTCEKYSWCEYPCNKYDEWFVNKKVQDEQIRQSE